MNTFITGFDEKAIQILSDALQRRQHTVESGSPDPGSLQRLRKKDFSLIVLSDFSEEGIRFCRQVRAEESGKRYTILAVIGRDQIDQLHRLLDADVDQYVVESLFDEQRLDVRLAFAEKMARDKKEQFIIEQKLRESEARARSILRTTVDAIITIDERGTVRTFNKAAENLFQFGSSEVIGKNVNVLMPQPYRREHDSYLENYHKTGKRKIIGIGREVTGKRKDGTTFPMYLAVSEVNVNGQRLYTGIIRDITEQRRLEQEVLRISEHERHRIGQDLHDGLGQMLTGMTMINKNIASSLKEEGHPLAGEVEEITTLIKEADEYARGLSRNLIPVEFERHGLTAALKRLAGNAEKLLGITCEVRSTQNIQFEDSTSLANLFRIAQEATSNAVKHGNAQKVLITLDATAERILLKIEDDGVGFSTDWDKQQGLGVRIMQFRAQLVSANFEIGQSDLGGASITITVLSIGSSYTLVNEEV